MKSRIMSYINIVLILTFATCLFLSFFIEGKLLSNHDLLDYCKHSPDDQMSFIPKIHIILNANQVIKQGQVFYYYADVRIGK